VKAVKKESSLYELLGNEIRKQIGKQLSQEDLPLPEIVRQLRQQKKLSGAQLCRCAGDLDPRTLTAVEKGRIKNPSIKTLLSISRGLGLTVSDLFRQADMELDRNFRAGSQKGTFQMDFPSWKTKIISFTPLIKEFFCGKVILGPEAMIDETFLKHSSPIFISTLIGRIEIEVAHQKVQLREGENLFFNGCLRHSFANKLHRESVLLMVTAPSLF